LPQPTSQIAFVRGLEKEAIFEKAWMGDEFLAATGATISFYLFFQFNFVIFHIIIDH
jgi:hypothetical protein